MPSSRPKKSTAKARERNVREATSPAAERSDDSTTENTPEFQYSRFLRRNTRIYKCSGFVYPKRSALNLDETELSKDTMVAFKRLLKSNIAKELQSSEFNFEFKWIDGFRPNTKSLFVKITEKKSEKPRECSFLFLHGNKHHQKLNDVHKIPFALLLINGDVNLCKIMLDSVTSYMSNMTSLYKFKACEIKLFFAKWCAEFNNADANSTSTPLKMIFQMGEKKNERPVLELKIDIKALTRLYAEGNSDPEKADNFWNSIDDEIYRIFSVRTSEWHLLRISYPSFAINTSGQVRIKTHNEELGGLFLQSLIANYT